ncbi:L,D-transpeptidase [Pontibacillus halophilus JSM 076056 = DSM 19796]|uniref:L,D-transpeptidase n=1 Tax=Pontibacillus halophilus JSM 076056 = DSM 19796 TaxID=1385510 RepID=A0A0A5I631_9BACI|nr:L,D-transpeptidase [Pontibacillus halophilus]KGX91287.1 L,D-transpeptidase [Pontibacillus halophilus JSM 076056 = DSM 19796]
MQSLLVFILLTVSPIWPVGENPAVGYPFLIVNKATNELAYINDGAVQGVYPVGTGKTEELTPEGLHTITVKAKNPYYRKKNIPGGDPRNPLGSRWIGFDALDTDGRIYGVHGTNNPSSIGKYVSNGCIRMNNKDVEGLFDNIPIGTKILVTTTDESFESLGKTYKAIQ